ncbi:hypothetical protein [Sellimonas intestinalis]|uniref:hypothetical protein n=1 Tax=Sellimonas intestinalis TaxID=1653434 RepID=UPI0015EB3475|nr:hypothetical protein [Sellimonas intestinalis]MBA2213615.1 hypothetical protein [Sellimonas intestinalis]
MFIKITDRSQLFLLRQLNRYLGKRKLPDAVLGLIRQILKDEVKSVHDYIALFLDPIQDDTISIYDALHLHPYTFTEWDRDFELDVKDRRDGNRITWSGYGVEVRETGGKIYLIYSMRKKDVRRKGKL